jgi:hypothetical protein
MSSSFLETALAATLGVTIFHLLEALVWTIKDARKTKQEEDFWEEYDFD